MYTGYKTLKECFPDLLLYPKFCWETKGTQDGEVVITLRRKTISRWSQRLRQCFRARPIHLHQHRHCPT